jgi:AcrR family transcriptional regulator
MTSRQEQKQATRRALLDAARLQMGAGELQIGPLTKAAGVAHGTFYVHFPSKDALLDELLADFNLGLAEKLAPCLTDVGPVEQVVGTAARVFLDWWTENRDFVERYAERLAGGLNLEALRDGINPPAALLLEGALAARGVEHAGVVAQGLLAAWMRIGLQHLFAPGVGREEAVDALVAITLGVLR